MRRSPVTIMAACQGASAWQRVLQMRTSRNFREASECGSPISWATRAANWFSKSGEAPANRRTPSKLAGKTPPSKHPSTKRARTRNAWVHLPSAPTTQDLDNKAFRIATHTFSTASSSEPDQPGVRSATDSLRRRRTSLPGCKSTKSKTKRTSSRKGFFFPSSAAASSPNITFKAASC